MYSESFATLTPAYGRDYKSAEAAKDDFLANRDFYLQPQGQLINREQIAPSTTVHIRYNRLTKVTQV
jgi:hypothetical protein